MKSKLASLLLLLSAVAGIAGSAAPSLPKPAQSTDGVRTINITAKRFTFEPAEVTLKKGEPVKLVLKSEDVTHGIFVRPLKLDQDIPAGKTVEVTITPQTAGKFTAICDHFCGAGHGNMKMTFIVQE